MKNLSRRRSRLLTLVGTLSVFIVVLFIGVQPSVTLAQDEEICHILDDGSGYTSNPTNPTTFTTTRTYQIIEIDTQHTLDAFGRTCGLGLKSSDGTTYGPWEVPFINGSTWIHFWAYPNVVIPPGTYTVTNSEHATWGCNIASSIGFAIVKGIPQEGPDITLELLYPVGESPKVFTNGWLFGAKCINNQIQEDLSDKVEWSGTGSFQPATGSQSRPTFLSAGRNTITLTFEDGNLKVSKDFTVEAVSPDNYARVGSFAACPADAHFCYACPHMVSGPVESGSPTVFIKGQPAARVGDSGIHGGTLVCCGPNSFVIGDGDPEVLIDGRAAARFGDKTIHCGGVGKLIKKCIDPQVVYLLLTD